MPKATFESVTQLLIDLRQIKTPAEVALMERAADINDVVLKAVLDKIRVGMTEIQVAGIAETVARDMNAHLASATLVLSGMNTNYPAWWPSERKIERGDYVMLDFNPGCSNYTNDGGTTILMPGAAKEQKGALRLGHRILKEIIPQIKPHGARHDAGAPGAAWVRAELHTICLRPTGRRARRRCRCGGTTEPQF